MDQFALFAGSAAAAIFMLSQLPMLTKAFRTRDLASYSFANLALANVGNLLYAVYVVQMPIGPVWAVHSFNVSTSGLMLFWYLRYGWSPLAARGPGLAEGADRSSRVVAVAAAPGQPEERAFDGVRLIS